MISLDVKELKDQLLNSDNWDKILVIRDYCNELLEHSDFDKEYLQPSRNQLIDEAIDLLETLR